MEMPCSVPTPGPQRSGRRPSRLYSVPGLRMFMRIGVRRHPRHECNPDDRHF